MSRPTSTSRTFYTAIPCDKHEWFRSIQDVDKVASLSVVTECPKCVLWADHGFVCRYLANEDQAVTWLVSVWADGDSL